MSRRRPPGRIPQDNRPDLLNQRPWWNDPDSDSVGAIVVPCALAVAALAYQQGAHVYVWRVAGLAFLSTLAVMIARTIQRLKRSRMLTGLHFAVFLGAAGVGHLALVEGDRLRTEKAAQERRAVEQQIQRAKEEAERKDREVAERCTEMIDRLARRRNAANAEHRKCALEAPQPTFWNQRTPAERCKDKEDAAKRAAAELRAAEQRPECQPPPKP